MKCHIGVCSILFSVVLLAPVSELCGAEQDVDFSREITKTITGQYILRLPEGYADGEEEWPIMLLLHGAGERGNELHRVKGNWPRILEFRQDFPFIVVAPQCPKDEWWASERAMASLRDALEKCRVDMDRVYVTGLSMGGFGTWRIAAEYSDMVAAVAPVCGGIDPDQVDKLLEIPIWAFHGEVDNVVEPEQSRKIVDAIKKAGGNAKLTIYPGVGHGSWGPAYADPSLYLWMLDNAKSEEETGPSTKARKFFEDWRIAYDFQRKAGEPRVSLSSGSDKCTLLRRNESDGSVTETLKWVVGEGSDWRIEPLEWSKEFKPGEEAFVEFSVVLTCNSAGKFPLPRIESTVSVDGQPFIKEQYALPVYEEFYSEHARAISCRKLTAAPELDGVLMDDEWSECEAASGFLLLDGSTASAYPTEVSVGYDDEALYYAFRCVQKDLNDMGLKHHIRDGNLWEDDSVEVFLDTDINRKDYYHWIANADGYIFDELNRGESWNSEAQAVSGRDGDAWTLEMMIPWSSLPEGAPEAGDRMGFELIRTHVGGGWELSQWAPTLGDNHTPTRFGLIIFE